MIKDQLVLSQDVLRAVMAVRREGTTALIERWEAMEPDLIEFALEEFSAIHQLVLSLGGKPRIERRITRRVESMALVLLQSLRQSQVRLWQDQIEGTTANQTLSQPNDPTPGQPPPLDQSSDGH